MAQIPIPQPIWDLMTNPRTLGGGVVLVCLLVIVWMLANQDDLDIEIPAPLKPIFPYIVLFLTTVLAFWGIYLIIFAPPIEQQPLSIDRFRQGIYSKGDSLIVGHLNRICAESEPVAIPYSFYRKVGGQFSLYLGTMEFPGKNSSECNRGRFIDYNPLKGFAKERFQLSHFDREGELKPFLGILPRNGFSSPSRSKWFQSRPSRSHANVEFRAASERSGQLHQRARC